MKYKILLGPKAIKDIQKAIDWYNRQGPGLGKKFHLVLKSNIEQLKENPYFQVRYESVRCLPLNKYSFMIHFSIDESSKAVFIRAVFNTSLNPEKWKEENQ